VGGGGDIEIGILVALFFVIFNIHTYLLVSLKLLQKKWQGYYLKKKICGILESWSHLFMIVSSGVEGVLTNQISKRRGHKFTSSKEAHKPSNHNFI
jgi:hypothetical protein